jgi:hypothetical protein
MLWILCKVFSQQNGEKNKNEKREKKMISTQKIMYSHVWFPNVKGDQNIVFQEKRNFLWKFVKNAENEDHTIGHRKYSKKLTA